MFSKQPLSFTRVAIAAMVCTAGAAITLPVSAQTPNGTTLGQYIRDDGKLELYLAGGDGPLTKAFEVLGLGWSTLMNGQESQLQAHIDTYLPIELRDMGSSAADAMELRIAQKIIDQRTSIGLVPKHGVAYQLVSFPRMLGELVRWFPSGTRLYPGHPTKTETVLDAVKSVANATIQRMLPTNLNVAKVAVNATTGASVSVPFRLQYLGEAAEGLADLTAATGDPSYINAIDPKLEWVWSHRPNSAAYLLPDELSESGPFYQDCPNPAVLCPQQTSDSDTLYYVRSLFSLWEKLRVVPGQATLAKKYRSWALAVTDAWFDHAWMPTYGHFSRKLNFDQSPYNNPFAGGYNFNSDAVYNTYRILVWAYRATNDPKYLERLKTAHDTLVERSGHPRKGIIASSYTNGVGNGLIDSGHHLILDALVEGFNVSGDAGLLNRAQALADVMYPEDRAAWGGLEKDYIAGAAFLRLAHARRRIHRLQVTMSTASRWLRIFHGEELPTPAPQTIALTADNVYGQIAVVYLPQGTYTVTTGASRPPIPVTVTRDQAVSF